MRTILDGSEGDNLILLGNEAVVRGALEAGVEVATTYPGTPSSEVGDTFSMIARKAGIYFEYSTNEKVALEVASAASASGLRAFCTMKHVGLNVAADPFVSTGYIGVRGGFVIMVADDPSMHSSQNEQDSRHYAQLANLPVLEPADPQECKEFTAGAFDLSERLEVPVLLRTTTRVSHVRGRVLCGPLRPPAHAGIRGEFVKDPSRWVLTPANAMKRRLVLLEKAKEALALAEASPWNRIEEVPGREVGRIGILTASVSYHHVRESLATLGISARVLKLGFTHPFPRDLAKRFMDGLDTVFVVEELDPSMEKELRETVQMEGLTVRVRGKEDGLFPYAYEYAPDIVTEALVKGLGLDPALLPPPTDPEVQAFVDAVPLPPRPPVLCPGCPHRATFYCVQKVFGRDAIYPMDIGCYTLGIQPPFRMADYQLCMGSSVGTACGFARSTDKTVVPFIGDSTFFHAGIPPLINAVHNKHSFLLVVVDNRTTAMTGHQPHPGITIDGMGDQAPRVSIEEVVMGCGVEFVEAVDPMFVTETITVLEEAKRFIDEHRGPAVIISKHPCILLEVRRKRHQGKRIPRFYVDQTECKNCKVCINEFGCPAFYVYEDRVHINRSLCNGCTVCAKVCPFGAIHAEGGDLGDH